MDRGGPSALRQRLFTPAPETGPAFFAGRGASLTGTGKEKGETNMEQIMDQLAAVVATASDFVWNSVLLYVLVFTGILFTIRLGFIQVRKFGTGWRQMFGSFSLSGKKAG